MNKNLIDNRKTTMEILIIIIVIIMRIMIITIILAVLLILYIQNPAAVVAALWIYGHIHSIPMKSRVDMHILRVFFHTPRNFHDMFINFGVFLLLTHHSPNKKQQHKFVDYRITCKNNRKKFVYCQFFLR